MHAILVIASALLRSGQGWRRGRLVAGCMAWLLGVSVSTHAALQFDVFLGYDGAVREAAWFPVACEVYNDGPSFNAVLELSAGSRAGAEQVRRVPLELPTNTRKRLVIPMFAFGGQYSSEWTGRLLDERGKVHAVRENLQPKFIPWEGNLVGALPRTFAGVPVLPEGRQGRSDLKSQVARMQAEQFPDNPIALEGLSALYLNSEKALALKVNQITALLAWVYEGGHLVVSVEQLADINSTPWLQQLLPCELTDMVSVAVDEDLLQWLRQGSAAAPPGSPSVRPARPGGRPSKRPTTPQPSPLDDLEADPNFYDAHVPVAIGHVRDGRVILSANNNPLVVQADRGRGRVTLLTFSPEREPLRSWKHRPLFWSKVLDLPTLNPGQAAFGGTSMDGVFGALLETRQVRKLPVEWLLLLLVVYLIVIGPFDQYWLKKINRQMLTWITFPTYVILFSLLIYFIGYKLRAGETEWNELQVVDILNRGQNAAFRGRTFVSIYSSANAKYQLAFTPPSEDAADQTYACLRGELLDPNTGGKEASQANVEHRGNVFRADIFVPVWTSLLYVNDWFQPASAPLAASLSNHQDTVELRVENLLNRPLTDARVAHRGRIYELGTLPAHRTTTLPLDATAGVSLQEWVVQHSSQFQGAGQARHQALGDAEAGRLKDLPLTSMVASFYAEVPRQEHQRSFIGPPGLDLSSLVERGDAVLLAWDANQGYAKPVNQFKAPRSQRNSLLRLAIPGDDVRAK